MKHSVLKPFGLLAALAILGSAHAGTTTFDGTTNGWGIYGSNDGDVGDFLRNDGGNPGGHLEFRMVDTFGVRFHNDTDASLLGDYSRFSQGITFSLDVKAETITYLGNEVNRDIVLELVDYDNPAEGYPYTSVWTTLGTVGRGIDWQTLSTTITDTTATALPTGWGGYGAEDPVTYEPTLPASRTFASVLASVDEVRFTTFKPGYFYGFTNYHLRYDNASVQAVPEPATLAVLLPALAMLRRRRK